MIMLKSQSVGSICGHVSTLNFELMYDELSVSVITL